MSMGREEFKLIAREMAVDAVVTASLERLLEGVIATVVRVERARCVALTLEAATERDGDGDPEGAGAFRDLAQAMKAA